MMSKQGKELTSICKGLGQCFTQVVVVVVMVMMMVMVFW